MADLSSDPRRPPAPRIDQLDARAHRDRRRTPRRLPRGRRGEGGLGHAGHPAGPRPRRGHLPPSAGHRGRRRSPTSPSSCSACCSPRRIASRSPATDPTRRPTSRRRTASRSGLDTVATRVDHVVVAVRRPRRRRPRRCAQRFGFHELTLADPQPGIVRARRRRRHVRARRRRGVAGRARATSATRGAGCAARRDRGAQRRLRPGVPRRRRRAAAHRGRWSTPTVTSSSSRPTTRPPACSSGSSPAPVTESASAPPTCSRCSTRLGRRRVSRVALGSALRTTAGVLRDSRNATAARCALATIRPLCRHAMSPSRRRPHHRRPLARSHRLQRRRRPPSDQPRPTTIADAGTDSRARRLGAAARSTSSSSRRAVPRRSLRGQQGRRHHHLPVQLRLRRLGIDRRRARRRAEGLLRRAVPRRRAQAQLLRRQLPAASPPTTPSSRRAARSARWSTSPAPTTPASSRWPSRADRHRCADHQGRAQATTLERPRGHEIGVKGAITPSVKAMLRQAGLVEGTDYETVLLDGFDPKVHIEMPDIVGFPGYKSNEPLQLEAAGIPFKLFDPATTTSPAASACSTPTSTFLQPSTPPPRRTSCGPRCAASPTPSTIRARRAGSPSTLINANGNAMFLSPEGEIARWGVESKLGRADATRRRAARRCRSSTCSPTRSPPTPRSACSTVSSPDIDTMRRHRRCSTASTTTTARSSGRLT